MAMSITAKTVTIDNRVIQTRNISEASSWKNDAGKPTLGTYIFAIILILAGLAGASSTPAMLIVSLFGGGIIWGATTWKPTFELHLQTNAGKVSAFSSKDSSFIDEVLFRIHQVMSEPNTAAKFEVNVDAKTIQENHVNVNNSSGVNVVGGDAANVTQTATVGGPTLADISQLIAMVQASDSANREQLQSLLEDVRNHMAGGGRSKEQAKASWQQFVQGVGALSNAGSALWDVVGKISKLFV